MQAEDLLKLIDAKGGDYYRPSLHPQGDAAYDAIKNFAFGGHNNPLAQEVAQDMRRYYGASLPTSTPVPAPAPQQVAVIPAPQQVAVTPAPRVLSTTKPQGPKAPAAQGPRRSTAPKPVQDFKDAKVETVKATNPNTVSAKTQEILEQDQLMAAQQIQELSGIGQRAAQELEQGSKNDLDMLLLSGALLGTGAVGAGVGRATAPQEELTDEEKLMLYLSQTSQI